MANLKKLQKLTTKNKLEAEYSQKKQTYTSSRTEQSKNKYR